MSIIEGSTLRRLGSFQLNRNLIRTGSGVGAGESRYSTIRNLETGTFSERVLSPHSGIRAGQDSIDFSQKAYDTGRSLTRGHRLGAEDGRRWQYTIDSALQTASKQLAKKARAEKRAALSQPLESNLSTNRNFQVELSNPYLESRTVTSYSAPHRGSDISAPSPQSISWQGKQALESYGLFSSAPTLSTSYSVEA